MTISLNVAAGYRVSRVSSSRLRLTARGRAVILAAVAVPLATVVIAVGLNAGGATATESATPLRTVTVAAGESLWQVARSVAPQADPRDVVSGIMRVNQLDSVALYPGEKLAIPAEFSS